MQVEFFKEDVVSEVHPNDALFAKINSSVLSSLIKITNVTCKQDKPKVICKITNLSHDLFPHFFQA